MNRLLPDPFGHHKYLYEWVVALFGVWCCLILNWASFYWLGELMFETARLQGMTTLMSFVLPGACIGIALLFGSMRLKLLAVPALLVFAAIAFASCFVIGEAVDKIATNKDPTMEVTDFRRVDAQTCIYSYYFNPPAFASPCRIERAETSVLPGVLWVRTLRNDPP